MKTADLGAWDGETLGPGSDKAGILGGCEGEGRVTVKDERDLELRRLYQARVQGVTLAVGGRGCVSGSGSRWD